MGEDWEELAGEKGEEVTSSRLKRMFKLGTMGARVGASTVASKVGSLLPGDKERRQDRLARSYAKNAERVVDVLGQLKGASMKVGQLLSADPELMPDEFADVMSSLQKDAPPMTYNTVRAQIEQAIDRPIEAVFSYFDPDPIGAASIGQVHRASLEDGQDVAVKVQYPGVADALVSDLKSLKTMLVYGRAFVDRERLDTIFEEVQRMLLQEADYELEAESLARFHEALKQRDGLRAPRAFPRWSSKQVLVMEYVEGTKLDEALVEIGPGPRRDELLKRWVQTYSWMFHELLELHADPHPGNFILQDDDTLVMLDFGCVKSFDAAFADGFLDILDATWQGDSERLVELYLSLGFGAEGTDPESIDPELMHQYQEIVVAPFLRDEPFDFTGWEPAKEGKLFMLRHPSFLKLVPPPDALAYFRVLSGIKGLLGKLGAEINVYRAAYETARRRGRLTEA
jgi:predicted unusual protein kinase regulating ubiquinone biosynthesis (AarF/ABC1/UbiB family)